MFQPELIHESMLDALRDAVRALGGAKAVGLSVAAAPKRRGRPPGTKNKNKDVPADLPKPQRKREGRAGKKGGGARVPLLPRRGRYPPARASRRRWRTDRPDVRRCNGDSRIRREASRDT